MERIIPLGPGIKTSEGEVQYPFQELKETFKGQHFDTMLVLGEGPIKDILFSDELPEKEQSEWTVFTADPQEGMEPKYRVIDVTPHGKRKSTTDIKLDKNPYYNALQAVDNDRNKLKQSLQKVGPLVKRRWGEANALAGGLLLYLGVTDRLILTGGGDSTKLSEAQAMQDVIIREFGRLFFEKETGQKVTPENMTEYQQFIETSLKPKLLLEEDAPNTIGNVANSANKYPEYFLEGSSMALVTSGHHLNRGRLLIKRITGIDNITPISAQEVLESYGKIRQKKILVEMQQTFQLGTYDRNKDERDYRNKLGQLNPDLTSKVKGEENLTDRLVKPEYVAFWGYVIGKLDDPRTVQNSLGVLKSSHEWEYAATEYFKMAGLNFNDYKGADMVRLQQEHPGKFNALKKFAAFEEKTIRDTVFPIPQDLSANQGYNSVN